jgi:hypothetical protein
MCPDPWHPVEHREGTFNKGDNNMASKTFLIRFAIEDADGQHQYDYSDDFLVDLDHEPTEEEGTAKYYTELFAAFKPKIKQAVRDWFEKDPEAVRDDIDQYGIEYNYDAEDWDGKEVDYVVDSFPARCVSHIPTEIMEANGFRNAPDPSLEENFYDDLGFLNY